MIGGLGKVAFAWLAKEAHIRKDCEELYKKRESEGFEGLSQRSATSSEHFGGLDNFMKQVFDNDGPVSVKKFTTETVEGYRADRASRKRINSKEDAQDPKNNKK